MAWQDDLRELDEALSAGRIKADEYRKRRDRRRSRTRSAAASPKRAATCEPMTRPT
jgi:hypothetical protein